MFKVCIVGLGAIGGWMAANLQRVEGLSVCALARGDTLAAVRENGLRLDSGEDSWRAPLRVSADPAELGQQDLVILAVKGPAIAGVAAQVAQLCGPDTRVLTALNGLPWWFTAGLAVPSLALTCVDPEGRIAALIPPERVIGCVVHASCALRGPGWVNHVMGNGLLIGEARGGTSPAVDALATLLVGAGFEAKAVESIQRDAWYKLWGNMTTNPVSALTGATTDRILADDLVREFTTAIMLEAAEVGERMGCPISQTPQDRHAITRTLGAFKTSMLQDIEAGRPIETDALLSAPRELAQQLGVKTPMLDALLGLTRLMDSCRGA
ncbi:MULTISPECIES: 2-dehydropantoate 2-reductase [unclassified Roseateles]|uniref:2-dehydropantoate 2-reductase n=1 Tax=unclassified Roseateles TaxID=2626991 RepID=UPI0006F6ED4B|nr:MULTISPECIES: 2-dehydropantoate 2-reductase [unclassified Roseateles]KQW46180.1 2-dehydropantoate 2-reductase [Pelomonas sp. Root405]KRA73229.1 2-dehydropantoate 2-reductase [Pelomonas sp. Root662]